MDQTTEQMIDRKKRWDQAIADGEIFPVRAGVFTRNPKRKEKETFEAYKRSRSNANKALKVRTAEGPSAMVFLSSKTYQIVTMEKF